MYNPKNFKYFFSIAFALSLLLGSQTLPAQAQESSPSPAQAGSVSGTPPAPNTTVFSAPSTAITLPPTTTTEALVQMITEGVQASLTTLDDGRFEIPITIEIITTSNTTGGTNTSSRTIESIEQLTNFLNETVGTILGSGTGQIIINGTTINITIE